MSVPSTDRLTEALATVQDPEIKRPITELGMVDHLEVDAEGLVRVTVLLTVSGCPMKDTIDRDVRNALGAVDGVTGVELTLGAMTPEQRAELQTTLRGGAPAKEIPFAQPGSLTKVFAIASGKGGVGKSSVTVNLALALAKAGRTVGIVDADIYGHSIPAMLGLADSRPTQVEDMIMPVPTASGVSVISIGMLKPRRDQVVAWRGPMLDRALVQMLADVYWGDLDVLLLDLPPGTGDMAISLGQHLPERRDRRRDHAPGGGRRGRRARRDDGLDAPPARRRRDREHELPGLPPLWPVPPARALRQRRRRPGGRHPERAVRVRRTAARAHPDRGVAARGRRRRQAGGRLRSDAGLRPGADRGGRPARLAGPGSVGTPARPHPDQ